jgi:hypothetical protein
MVVAQRYVASVTWNRRRPDDLLRYRDLSAQVVYQLDWWLGLPPVPSHTALWNWYRNHECDQGGQHCGTARTRLEYLNDIGERLGPKPRRLARVAMRRYDDGLDQLADIGYGVQYRAAELPPEPDERALGAAYQFDIVRGLLRRMMGYEES